MDSLLVGDARGRSRSGRDDHPGGSIASLSDLIVDAATDAIDFGTEAITLDLLDSIAIDDVVPGVAR